MPEIVGQKMSDFTPLAAEEKEYFFGDGEGSVVTVGKVSQGGTDVNRLVKLSDIKGDVQQQVDWTEDDVESISYIRNKPTIPAAQIQANWTQEDITALDYIKNKPTGLGKGIKAGSGITITADENGVMVISKST